MIENYGNKEGLIFNRDSTKWTEQWYDCYENERKIYYKDYHNSEYWFDYNKKGNKIHAKVISDIDRSRFYLKFIIKSQNDKITDIELQSADCRYLDPNRSEFTMIKG